MGFLSSHYARVFLAMSLWSRLDKSHAVVSEDLCKPNPTPVLDVV